MDQRGWKHYGTRSLPENTYYRQARQETQQHSQRSTFAHALIGVFALSGLVISVLYNPFFFIKAVRVTGVESLPPEIIEKNISAQLEGYRFGVVPRKNIFFIDRKKIEGGVKQFVIPEELTITAQWGNVLEVKIHEYPIVVYWRDGGTIYSMNELGYITEQIPNTHTVSQGSVTVEDSGRAVGIGKQILNPNQVQWLLAISEAVKRHIQIPITKIVVSQTHPSIVDLTLNNTIDVVATVDDPPEPQILRLKALMDSKPSFIPANQKQRHTIDLRFGEKIYYK